VSKTRCASSWRHRVAIKTRNPVAKTNPHTVAKVGALSFTCCQTLATDGASLALAGVLNFLTAFVEILSHTRSRGANLQTRQAPCRAWGPLEYRQRQGNRTTVQSTVSAWSGGHSLTVPFQSFQDPREKPELISGSLSRTGFRKAFQTPADAKE